MQSKVIKMPKDMIKIIEINDFCHPIEEMTIKIDVTL